jgi:DNA polymerase III alpha subunit
MSHHTYNGYIDFDKHRLWCDGDIVVKHNHVMDYILKYNPSQIYTNKITPEIQEYNNLADNPIIKKLDLNFPEDIEWNIPDHYKTLNIKDYVFDKLSEQPLSDKAYIKRINRIKNEYNVYKRLNLLSLLQALVYVIDTFTEKNVVWGVGRGSSVASYILYLIGVHDIDSVQYNLDFNEFLQ